MPSLAYLKLTDKLACQASPTTYGVLHPEDLASATDVLAIEDSESMAFSYHRLNALGDVRGITAQMRAGRVIAVVWSDGTFDEWRVGVVTDGRGMGGIISVECVPLWRDLVERADSTAGRGWVSELVGSERIFDYEIAERTPSSILSSFVIPNLPSWVTLGTVDPTVEIPALSVNHLTPWALAIATRDALRGMDVTCELRLRRNGTTDYKLDLVTQVGSSAATPTFHPSNSLLTLSRKTDPTLQATRVLVNGGTAPDTLPGILGRARWRVGTPSGTTLPLTDRNGGASPVAFDNQWVGAYILRVKTGRTFAITSSSAAAGTVTCSGGVSTIAADEDVEFRLTEPGTNTRTTTTRYAVSAVADGTHITCGVSAPITVDNQYTDWYAKVWSAAAAGTVIATTRISASVAATDVLTVASSAGVNNTHYVEFVQTDGAGEIPCYVDHPTYSAADPTGYGIKCMELARGNNLGVTQLIPNSWMRTWTNSANPPDGWSKSGAAATSRDATNTRYGGYAWRINPVGGLVASLLSPVFYPSWSPTSTDLSVRAWVYLDAYTVNGGTDFSSTLNVYAATAAGAAGASLASVSVKPTDAATGTAVKVGTGTWVELKVEGLALSDSDAAYGIIVGYDIANSLTGTELTDGYLDTIEAYPFPTCPFASYEFGDATALAQAGNGKLDEVASPPVFYEFSVRDLERAFPTEFSRLALTLGGNVRAADVEYGIDTTVRLLKIQRDLLNPTATQLTLGNRPLRFTSIARGGSTTKRDAASTLVTNAGSAVTLTAPPTNVPVTTYTAAATIPDGAEVTTTAAPPVLTVDSGATLIIAPATTTAPRTGIAVVPSSTPRRTRPTLI